MFSISTKWLLPGNRCILTLFVVIAFCPVIHAQVEQTGRYESHLNELDDGYEVVPAGKLGLYTYRHRVVNSDYVLEIALLDTTLQPKWHGYIPIQKKRVVVQQQFHDSTLYLMLRYQDLVANDFQVLAVRPSNGNFILYNIKNFIPLRLTEFHVTHRAVLIGGYYNITPVLIYYDFETLQSKIVPGMFNDPGELTQVKTYSDGSFDALVSTRIRGRKKMVVARSYDAEAHLVRSVTLEPDENKNLIFGRSIKTRDHRQIIAGTYSNFTNDISKGIFTANLEPGTDTPQIQYYNYGDLENFFHYLSSRHEARIKNRIARRKIKGRKIRFNYRLLVHDLIPYRNQYLMLGEAFYPHYSYPNSTFGYFPSAASSSRYAVFDGYYYTHAVIVCFDNSGNILWDNSFEINDVKSYTLRQFVNIDIDRDRISLLYLFDNKIRSKVIQSDGVLEDKIPATIKLGSEDDVIKKNDVSVSKLEHWYQHYFIAYGTQRISSRKNDSRRKVFFINKIKAT